MIGKYSFFVLTYNIEYKKEVKNAAKKLPECKIANIKDVKTIPLNSPYFCPHLFNIIPRKFDLKNLIC